ncbi:hypothetical protein RCL_jg16976.t1 [Rhizophagus clarus]|uniref:Uncharacterized protein n=1 Tax=Rhizophagus clarus TaxID=94130 RepID=A0A8H3LI86_9GLOM|nr:hypothetical protein RCL_jg16976.t1 [Rhizophagus clarus]
MTRLTIEQRAQAIMMIERGFASRKIAAKIGCESHTTIIRLKKKRLANGECSTAISLTKSLQVNENIEVSADIVHRILKKNGLVSRVKHRCQYCWKKPGELLKNAYVKPTVKFGGSNVFVWRCFTSRGINFLCRIDGGLDAELYCQILDEDFIETLRYYDLNVSDIVF